MQNVHCSIDKISQLTPYTHQIEMTPSAAISFKAGQYLIMSLSNGKKTPFSIASPPSKDSIVIQVASNGLESNQPDALTHCLENQQIHVQAGLGDAYFQSCNTRPVILFAAGSGFSYVKSIAEHLAEKQHQAPVLLYWGVRSRDALFMESEIAQWEELMPNFHFIPVVKNPEQPWRGRSGSLLETLLEDISDLSPYDIYLAGRFDVMPKVRDTMLAHGAQRQNMFSDSFAYI